MTAPITEQLYAYGRSSALVSLDGHPSLRMATSGGLDANLVPAAHPYFYSGFPREPMSVAAGLLVVAKVARSRYYVPPGMLAAILRAADPVVTSSPHGLRFESFSACCGVHARLDVAAGALDTEFQASGVTNVDVNPPLRQALAGLRPGEPLHLAVGDDGLRVRTLDAEAVEEKVELPRRWLKGFCEVQASTSTVALRHELGPEDARRFIRSLPRTSPTGSVAWATRAVRSLRLASRPSPGAVCLAGPERLRTLEPLMRFATGLRIYGPESDSGSLPSASTWVLDLPGARLSLTLSPDKSRGFSGEGGVLHAGFRGGRTGRCRASSPRRWPSNPASTFTGWGWRPGCGIARVADALAVLASSGQVGFRCRGAGLLPPAAALRDGRPTRRPSPAGGRAQVAFARRRRPARSASARGPHHSLSIPAGTNTVFACGTGTPTAAAAPGLPNTGAAAARASTSWPHGCTSGTPTRPPSAANGKHLEQRGSTTHWDFNRDLAALVGRRVNNA